MKVYVATSGEYSDYRIAGIFARREDAEAYKLGDRVEEYEVAEGPVEVRPWHTLLWRPDIPDRAATTYAAANPNVWEIDQDFDGDYRRVTHEWREEKPTRRRVLYVHGWDLERVRKVYGEQRAQYLAGQAGQA